MNASGVGFVRDGAAIRSRHPAVYLLGLVVLMCLRDRARRVRIARAGAEGEMHAFGPDGTLEMVPPPAHVVDALYRLLAEGDPPRPRWWSPLSWRSKPVASVPHCWSGEIEALLGETRVPIACDLMAYPDGVSVVLEFCGDDDQRDEYARAAEEANRARRKRFHQMR